jgi:hypothetical protein
MAADRRMVIETMLFILIELMPKSFISFYALGFVLVSLYCVFVGCMKVQVNHGDVLSCVHMG